MSLEGLRKVTIKNIRTDGTRCSADEMRHVTCTSQNPWNRT